MRSELCLIRVFEECSPRFLRICWVIQDALYLLQGIPKIELILIAYAYTLADVFDSDREGIRTAYLENVQSRVSSLATCCGTRLSFKLLGNLFYSGLPRPLHLRSSTPIHLCVLVCTYIDALLVSLCYTQDDEEEGEGEEEGLSKCIGKELKKLLQCHSHRK
ncbi:uncharacterized protein LOC109822440 isoform X1 [Asparagus officinalis]|uniref:uncharacterized protein LOC109822440 isoform X1 n=2 Tax=Asparagus officinalis TaxID=4686 RepID=UPI00098E26ED|nr:uncharacterized protein LOC109822440 isoform X1 [Asparagus officinalis]XP_020244224.1 uncharacterized protein LOC109822440 isoform X1 [Asparagus officinalis]XP_020244225.1 uncharacterized protein LOC109822440 isoform X1 [Asparagus officinalis]XP_020244226.1 uncharacterized protein LOC109822440 isoform X1 [Asparagus officinalis]